MGAHSGFEVPRFVVLLGHFVLLIVLLWDVEVVARSSLPWSQRNDNALVESIQTQITAGLATSTTLVAIELTCFMIGEYIVYRILILTRAPGSRNSRCFHPSHDERREAQINMSRSMRNRKGSAGNRQRSCSLSRKRGLHSAVLRGPFMKRGSRPESRISRALISNGCLSSLMWRTAKS